MIETVFNNIYEKFKINFYKHIFNGFEQSDTALTALESFYVEVIYVLQRPTINELANFLNMSQPNVAYKIGCLVKKGYIKKIQSQIDKREFYLEVTEKFYEYYNIKNEYVKLVLSRLKYKFSENDIKQFENMLNVINEELMPEINNFIRKKYELM